MASLQQPDDTNNPKPDPTDTGQASSAITPLQLVESATALNVIARNTQQQETQPISNNLQVPEHSFHKKLARTSSGHRQLQRTKEKEELSRRPSYKRILEELQTPEQQGDGTGTSKPALLRNPQNSSSSLHLTIPNLHSQFIDPTVSGSNKRKASSSPSDLTANLLTTVKNETGAHGVKPNLTVSNTQTLASTLANRALSPNMQASSNNPAVTSVPASTQSVNGTNNSTSNGRFSMESSQGILEPMQQAAQGLNLPQHIPTSLYPGTQFQDLLSPQQQSQQQQALSMQHQQQQHYHAHQQIQQHNAISAQLAAAAAAQAQQQNVTPSTATSSALTPNPTTSHTSQISPESSSNQQLPNLQFSHTTSNALHNLGSSSSTGSAAGGHQASSGQNGPVIVAEEAARKREVRLLKNREAARECRRKKKEYIKCLENRVHVLEAQNKALIEELKTLKDMYCNRE